MIGKLGDAVGFPPIGVGTPKRQTGNTPVGPIELGAKVRGHVNRLKRFSNENRL
jgi:hypothetical protein